MRHRLLSAAPICRSRSYARTILRTIGRYRMPDDDAPTAVPRLAKAR